MTADSTRITEGALGGMEQGWLRPASPLDGHRRRLTALGGGISVRIEPHAWNLTLRLDPGSAVRHKAETLLGLSLPGPGHATTEQTAGTGAGTGGRSAFWLGPDEWLVSDFSAGSEAELYPLEGNLAAVLRDVGGAVIDTSGQRCSLRISGPLTTDLLAKGCAIDLHPSVFPAGSAVHTLLGQANVVLHAVGARFPDFRILVRSSFAPYLAEWLLDAAVEYQR